MTVYFTDSSFDVLEKYRELMQSVEPSAVCSFFTSSKQLMTSVGGEPPDAVFIELEERNSMAAMERLVQGGKPPRLIVVSQRKEVPAELSGLHISGIMIKPVTREKMTEQMNNLHS